MNTLASTFGAVRSHALSQPLIAALLHDCDVLRLQVHTDTHGVTLVDAGVAALGSAEAGLRIAAIGMGGLGQVSWRAAPAERWPSWVEVHSSQPVQACHDALGEAVGSQDSHRDSAYLVLEGDEHPSPELIQQVWQTCEVPPERLTIFLVPARSLAGVARGAARVLEMAVRKAHQLRFPLERLIEGSATAPLPQPHQNRVQALGRAYDAIFYAGRVHLSVDADDAAASELAQRLPSANSPNYGQPFAHLLKAADHQVQRIDPALFAPAEVWVSSLRSGNTWQGGSSELRLLVAGWLGQEPSRRMV